jgi:hypothetical protein
MMTLDHASVFPRLSEYLDGELPSAETAAVKSHVAICQDCTQGLSELTAALDALRALRTEPDALDLAPVRQAVRAAAANVRPENFWALNLPRMFPNFAGAALASAMLIALGVLLIPIARRHSKQPPNSMVMVRLDKDEAMTQLPEAPVSSSPASSPAAASAPEAERQKLAAQAEGFAAPKSSNAPADALAERRFNTDEATAAGGRLDDRKADAGKAGADLSALKRREGASAKEAYQAAGSRDEEARARNSLYADKDQRAEKAAPADQRGGFTYSRAASAPAAAPAPPPVYSPVLPDGEPGPSAQSSVVTSETRYRITPSGAVLMAEGNRIAGAAEADAANEKKLNGPGATGAAAAQPERALEKQKKESAACHPAVPEFPAFPNIRPSDHMRLPLQFTVELDGGGHVTDVTYEAVPGQRPLAVEIAAWLRRQVVHPMICDGRGVAGEVQLTFRWDDGP